MVDYTDTIEHTRERMLAYLAAVQPMRGLPPSESYLRGRGLIQALAESAVDYDEPSRQLTLVECEDVIEFLRHSEPRQPVEFHKEPKGAPSHRVGLMMVYNALHEAVSARGA